MRSLLSLKEARSIESELAEMSGTIQMEGRRCAEELSRMLSQCIHLPKPAPRDRALDALRARAASLVPKRKYIGTMSLDLVPFSKREGFDDPRWDAGLTAALFWCDGQRNLAEVLDLAENELGTGLYHLVKFFEFLAKKGLIELRRT